ncbi:MAG: EAL domain-containing protein [Betaproteobacteria bacterium]|nr:EAL domain-containing protein [Betaproteobacteria bacterium]
MFAFAAAVLVVLGLATATWKLARDANEATQWVAHSHEVLSNLAQARAGTVHIELATQNYRILGEPSFLTERDEAIASREAVLGRIRQLTADNPSQQERWQALRQVLDQRLAISRQIQLLRKTQGIEAANAYVATAPLQATRARAYQLLEAMDQAESNLLTERISAQSHTQDIVTGISTLAAGALLLLLAGSYWLIRRQLRVAEASRRALTESEASLSVTLHSIGDAVLATDAQGCITRMNPVAEHLTGWPLAEARGRPVAEVFDIVSERTGAPAEIPVSHVLATGEARGLANHTALIARDGRQTPIADSAAPIRGVNGEVEGVVLVFRDVTAERQAEKVILDQNEQLEQRVQERTEQLQESEGHLQNIIGNVPALIAYVDAQQRYVYVNEPYRRRFAPDCGDLTGCTVQDVLGEERYAIAAPLIAKVLQGEPQSYDWQPFPGVWQVISYAPKRDASGRVTGYYVLGTDITERKAAEAKIQSLNQELERHVFELEHVSRALRTLSAGNRTMLRATNEPELLDSMCQAIVESGGYDTAVVWFRLDDAPQSLRPMAQHGYPAGLPGLQALQATWADDARGQGAVATAIRSGQTCVVTDMPNDPNYALWQTEFHDYASVIACPLRVAGEVIGALAIYDTRPHAFGADETVLLTESSEDLAFGINNLRTRAEQLHNQEAMHRLTHFDNLTGLPNEMQFAETLTATLVEARQLERPFALLQANIEHLSELNDALGFRHGDQLLCEFGNRLRALMPYPATVARLRGDEFAVLLPDSEASGALAAVKLLEHHLETPFRIADISLEVSAKIGVALFPDHGTTPHDLFRHVDIAVHLAKKKGLGHVVFDPAQNPDHSRRLTIASELRRAIEQGDLHLYLQPKVEIASGRLCGAEGLVRWQHPERGLIPPVEFVGLAENTGLIKPLTEWVVGTALRLNHAWTEQGCALPIAVNLSAHNLRDERLLDRIRHLLAAWKIAPGLFEMELTESTVMEDAEFALHVLHGLRQEGIPLYIDDFGTGYSSLAYLQKLPVDYIKIDQSFVRNLATRKESELIVRSTIDLIHDLGRKAVAEGIEDQASWNLLAALGCDYAQGYFIARPMPSDQFQAWAAGFVPPAALTGQAEWNI